jgi:protease-4
MPMTPDQMLDRKRLKARVMQWRLVAVLAILGAIAIGVAEQRGGNVVGKSYVARITLADILMDDPDRDALFKDALEDKHAKALIVRCDTPGGEAVAGQEVYLQLREISKHKPVVLVMRGLCASAGYMAALGADYVLARETTLTGSVGVMIESVEVSRLADKLGISPVTVTAGSMKDVPSFTRPMTQEERKSIEELVENTYQYFVGLVAERRKMTPDLALELADGRVYTGRQAYEVKLIDALGGEAEARDWLAKEHKISTTLDIRDIEPEPDVQSILEQLQQLTLGRLRGTFTVPLDGLVSIWHP